MVLLRLRQIGQILATSEAKLNSFLAAQDRKLPGHKPFCPLRVLRGPGTVVREIV